MKTCYQCKQEKDTDSFHKAASKPDGLQNECKICRSNRHRNTYVDRKEAIRASNLRQRKKQLEYIKNIKENTPCADCGGIFMFCCMDFDHLPGVTKSREISRLAGRYGWAILVQEIAKCELVCANCHRIRTYRRNHEGMTEFG